MPSRPRRRRARGSGFRAGSRSAGRSKTSWRPRDRSRARSETYRRATCRRLWAFSRCCQSGALARAPTRMRSARAAFSRNRAPYRADCASSPRSRSSISSGSSRRSATGGGMSASGKCSAIPSSDQSDCTSRSSASRSRARRAIAHGACTRPPNGERMQTRQSPISSRKRSTTIVRSEGTTPVATSCSRRYVTRFRAARASRPYSDSTRSTAASSANEAS